MFPLFPSLNPSLIGSLINSSNGANEEAETSAIEQEQQNYLNLVDNIASDLQPIGKVPQEEPASDHEDSDDGNESSESEEDDDDHDSDEVGEDRNVNY